MKTKFNKSEILKRAWKLFKVEVAKNQNNRTDLMFSQCLKQSWQIAKTQPSIESLYEAHYQGIYNFIYLKLHNVEVSQELSNDVFIKANQNLHLYNSEKSSISTWLFNIGKNLVIDHYRADNSDKYINVSNITNESGKEMYQFEDKNNNNNSVEMLENQELLIAIQKAMSNLKPKYQKVADLYFIADRPYNEIAELCELPLGSVKGMINRIKAMLQGQLQGQYQSITI